MKYLYKAIRKLKVGKTAGPDGVSNEVIKALADGIVPAITKIFNLTLGVEDIPKGWEISEIILLYKKGNQADINNHRPISLSSNLCKLMMGILKNRIYSTVDLSQPVKQAGFRRKYSTNDHIHTLSQLAERAKKYNLRICLLFIDFNKAFDSVTHSSMLEALSKRRGDDRNYPDYSKNIHKSQSIHKVGQKRRNLPYPKGSKTRGPSLTKHI